MNQTRRRVGTAAAGDGESGGGSSCDYRRSTQERRLSRDFCPIGTTGTAGRPNLLRPPLPIGGPAKSATYSFTSRQFYAFTHPHLGQTMNMPLAQFEDESSTDVDSLGIGNDAIELAARYNGPSCDKCGKPMKSDHGHRVPPLRLVREPGTVRGSRPQLGSLQRRQRAAGSPRSEIARRNLVQIAAALGLGGDRHGFSGDRRKRGRTTHHGGRQRSCVQPGRSRSWSWAPSRFSAATCLSSCSRLPTMRIRARSTSSSNHSSSGSAHLRTCHHGCG